MADEPQAGTGIPHGPEPQAPPEPQLPPEQQPSPAPPVEPAPPAPQAAPGDFTQEQKTWLGRKIQDAVQDTVVQALAQAYSQQPAAAYPGYQPQPAQPATGYQGQNAQEQTELYTLLANAQADPQTYAPMLDRYLEQRTRRIIAGTVGQSQQFTASYQQVLNQFRNSPLWKQAEPYLGRVQVSPYELNGADIRFRNPQQVAQEVFNAAVAAWAMDQAGKLPSQSAPVPQPGVQPTQTPPLGVAGPGNVVRQQPAANPMPPEMVNEFYRTARVDQATYKTEDQRWAFVNSMAKRMGYDPVQRPPEA